MKKMLFVFGLVVVLIAVSSRITRADQPTSHITPTSTITDHDTFHVVQYKSDIPIQKLGMINGSLLTSFSSTDHAWFFKDAFVPVTGTDPAKALGYKTMQTADSLLSLPKKSPCAVFKDAISSVSINDTKTLCLSSSAGGDYTLHLLPAVKDKPVPIGFGKQIILEKTRVSWVGYDGNLYMVYLHPAFFASDVTVLKEKTTPTVFLLRNGLRYSIPTEQIFYTWFDSFKSVSVIDAKKLATYPLIGKGIMRANTLIQFDSDPKIYAYQPPNDPYLVYGKDVKITDDKIDRWIIQDPKKKTSTIELLKRPELLRHVATEKDAFNTFGQTWNTHIFKLDAEQKTHFTISDKDFVPTQDILFE